MEGKRRERERKKLEWKGIKKGKVERKSEERTFGRKRKKKVREWLEKIERVGKFRNKRKKEREKLERKRRKGEDKWKCVKESCKEKRERGR